MGALRVSILALWSDDYGGGDEDIRSYSTASAAAEDFGDAVSEITIATSLEVDIAMMYLLKKPWDSYEKWKC